MSRSTLTLGLRDGFVKQFIYLPPWSYIDTQATVFIHKLKLAHANGVLFSVKGAYCAHALSYGVSYLISTCTSMSWPFYRFAKTS